jgi:hypothetical protein
MRVGNLQEASAGLQLFAAVMEECVGFDVGLFGLAHLEKGIGRKKDSTEGGRGTLDCIQRRCLPDCDRLLHVRKADEIEALPVSSP